MQQRWAVYKSNGTIHNMVFDDMSSTLQWRHNERGGVSNHQPHYCLLNRLFKAQIKKHQRYALPAICAGNSSVTGEFPSQMVSNAEKVSILVTSSWMNQCTCSCISFSQPPVWNGIIMLCCGTCLVRLGKSSWKHLYFGFCLAQSLQNYVYYPCHEESSIEA